jgi:hypothetical protein
MGFIKLAVAVANLLCVQLVGKLQRRIKYSHVISSAAKRLLKMKGRG